MRIVAIAALVAVLGYVGWAFLGKPAAIPQEIVQAMKPQVPEAKQVEVKKDATAAETEKNLTSKGTDTGERGVSKKPQPVKIGKNSHNRRVLGRGSGPAPGLRGHGNAGAGLSDYPPSDLRIIQSSAEQQERAQQRAAEIAKEKARRAVQQANVKYFSIMKDLEEYARRETQ